jgi:signal transduction histidine kinase
MDRETRESLFTLFFSSKGNKGTGLGLFIANKIIAQHGGKIKVDSKPNRGSSFRITIPQSP